MSMYKVTLTYDEFWKHTYDDAYNWFEAGYRAKDLTNQDILNEVPEEYWKEKPKDELYEDERTFTCKEYAEQVISWMIQFQEEEMATEATKRIGGEEE